MSILCDERKNVVRLIKAARKYGFRLVLAGSIGTEKDFEPLRKAIGESRNIEVRGWVSEEEKLSLYQRAKVFALPSISEGVGIVALDAAHFGCVIVVTDIGGPKEYYDGYGYRVNPYDVDDIGRSVMECFDNPRQPELSRHIDKHYSHEAIAQRLIDAYNRLLQRHY